MLTTIERVKAMGNEFSSIPDDRLTMFIEDASLEVSSLSFIVPEQYKEKLARYLTAHLATVNNKLVVREKVDVIERQYSDPNKLEGIFSTRYGQEYQRLIDALEEQLKPKKSINLVVL